MDRGADGDDFIRVDAVVRLFAEEVLDELLHERDAGGATDEHDLVYLIGRLFRVCEGLPNRFHRSLEEWADHLLETCARQGLLKVLRTARVGREERQVDRRLLGARHLALGLLGCVLEALDHHLVLRDVEAGVLLELVDQPFHDHAVDVITTEVRVTVGRDDLHDVVAYLEDRDVEGAAAEIVNGDDFFRLLVEAVGEGCGRRLVDDALDVEARDAAGVFGGLALRVIEVRGNGDDGFGHRLAEVILRGFLQLLQHFCADFLRRELFAADFERGRSACATYAFVGHVR